MWYGGDKELVMGGRFFLIGSNKLSPLKLGIVSSQQLIIRLSFATKLFMYLVAKVFVCSHVLKAGTMDDPSLAAAVVTYLLVFFFLQC